MKQRDSYIDAAKGICMLLIICIHTEVFGVIGMPLTFIAVPMFFFMSGFYDRSEKPWNEWMIKSLRTLVVPGLIWCVIIKFYMELLSYIKEGQIGDFSLNIYNPCEWDGPTWFLLALLYAKIFTGLIIRTKLNEYILLLLCVILGYVGATTQMPLLLDEGLEALPLYYVGKQMYPYLKQLIKNKLIVVIGVCCVCLLLMSQVYYTVVPLGNNSFRPCYMGAIIVSLFSFILVLYISQNLVKAPLIQNIGINSLGIMLVHSPICHTCAVILNRAFEKGSTVWIVSFLLAYIIIVIASYGISCFVERYVPLLFGK